MGWSRKTAGYGACEFVVKDAGRLIANGLNKQPFLDGIGGLFSQAEGERVIIGGVVVVGLAYAALTGSPAVALRSETLPACAAVAVDPTILDGRRREPGDKASLSFGD